MFQLRSKIAFFFFSTGQDYLWCIPCWLKGSQVHMVNSDSHSLAVQKKKKDVGSTAVLCLCVFYFLPLRLSPQSSATAPMCSAVCCFNTIYIFFFFFLSVMRRSQHDFCDRCHCTCPEVDVRQQWTIVLKIQQIAGSDQLWSQPRLTDVHGDQMAACLLWGTEGLLNRGCIDTEWSESVCQLLSTTKSIKKTYELQRCTMAY